MRHFCDDAARRAAESRGGAPLAFAVANRKPSIFTEDVDEFMAGQAILWEGDFSWAEMAAEVRKEYGYAPGVPSGEGVYVMEQVKASKGGNDYPRHRA